MPQRLRAPVVPVALRASSPAPSPPHTMYCAGSVFYLTCAPRLNRLGVLGELRPVGGLILRDAGRSASVVVPDDRIFLPIPFAPVAFCICLRIKPPFNAA